MFDYTLALQQLTNRPNPYGVLKAMIGAAYFVQSQEENSIRFSFKMCRKASVCKIQYDAGLDLYNMSFIKIRKIRDKLIPYFCTEESIIVKEYKEIMCDQLKGLFEEFTGLCLTLV